MTEEPDPYVWLTEERTWARLLNLGAYFSKVQFSRGGIDYEILIGNDEFEFSGEDTDIDDTED